MGVATARKLGAVAARIAEMLNSWRRPPSSGSFVVRIVRFMALKIIGPILVYAGVVCVALPVLFLIGWLLDTEAGKHLLGAGVLVIAGMLNSIRGLIVFIGGLPNWSWVVAAASVFIVLALVEIARALTRIAEQIEHLRPLVRPDED